MDRDRIPVSAAALALIGRSVDRDDLEPLFEPPMPATAPTRA
jgi:hypothetical protein